MMAGVQKPKIRWAIYLLLVMLYFFSMPVQAQYGGGTGEPNDPYLIYTAEQMNEIGANHNDWDKHFKLMADIDLSGFSYDAALIAPDADTAKSGFQGTPFSGVFDGNGHAISHLRIDGSSYLGLFGRLASGAEVKNLGLVDVNITGSDGYVGGLVGYNEGHVTNCYSAGSASGEDNVGGLVGINYGNVLNCYSTGSASGDDEVGGLVGHNYGNVVNCYSTGSASGDHDVGGLVGRNGWRYSGAYVYGNVLNCYSTGSANGDDEVGGLVGHNSGNVLNCYSAGSARGEYYVGGLVGVNSSGQVLNCYSTGSARGEYNVGGLVGLNLGSIIQCYSRGMISGNDYVGGLVGGGDSSLVNNSVWDVETSGLMNSSGGAGLTTGEMMDPGMLGLNGLGGDPNWVLDSGRDYPRLAWEERPGLIIPQPVIDWLDGTGTPEDPFQIENADQVLLLHKSSMLWNKHFVLNADIDLDPSLPGRIVFRRAVIPTFKGSFFGNGHAILNLQIEGVERLGFFGTLSKGSLVRNLGLENVLVHGTGCDIGGLAGYMSYISGGQVLNCYSTGSASGENRVGGLVGAIWTTNLEVINCYSTGRVSGNEDVGGLVGEISTFGSPNFPEDIRDIVINCYSTVTVSGNEDVGGLVGRVHRPGSLGLSKVASYYSTATVSGNEDVGRLVGGGGWEGVSVTSCFWDIQTSGQATSASGTGKTTAEMQTASTFLYAGWDFAGETANGTEDIWWIFEAQDYPRLIWELPEGLRLQPLRAFCPDPQDGATDVIQLPILHWVPAEPTLQHDIYFGESKELVANATTESLGIYRGRQVAEMIAYDPGPVEWDTTYYWRIDEVNEADPDNLCKGSVWSFTTANFLIVDDFESYNMLDPADPRRNRISDTWINVLETTTIGLSVFGHPLPSFPVNGGFAQWSPNQVMRYLYRNSIPVYYSDATANTANLTIGQDWTIEGVGVLSLWFYGDADNDAEQMYVSLANANGVTGMVYHDDPYAAQIEEWTEWTIDLQLFADQGVDLTDVETISIGFGDKNNPQPGGSGQVYFDDIRLYRSP